MTYFWSYCLDLVIFFYIPGVIVLYSAIKNFSTISTGSFLLDVVVVLALFVAGSIGIIYRYADWKKVS